MLLNTSLHRSPVALARRRPARVVGSLVLVAVLAGSCTSGSAGSSSSTGATDSASSATFSTKGLDVPRGVPTGRMRVVNLVVVAGQPGPAMDVYASGAGPVEGGAPLIRNLAYGKISDYVVVPSLPYSDEKYGQLSFYDAGTTSRTTGLYRGATDTEGVAVGEQKTVVVAAVPATGDSGSATTTTTVPGASTPSCMTITEIAAKGAVAADSAGNTDTGPKGFTVKPGEGLVVVSSFGAQTALTTALGDQTPFITFSLDGSCPADDLAGIPPDTTSIDSPAKLSGNGQPFTVDAGDHSIGLVVPEVGTGIFGTDCDGRTPAPTKTITVPANGAVAVFLTGTTVSDLGFLVAPIGT